MFTLATLWIPFTITAALGQVARNAMQRQLTGLARGCDLVAGTPGRVLDHLQRGTLSLSQVRYAVLDEADGGEPAAAAAPAGDEA